MTKTEETDNSERPMTFDHLKKAKKPVSKTVTVVLDPEVADRYNDVKDRIDRLQRRLDLNPKDATVKGNLVDAEAELEDMAEEVEASVANFVFHSIGRKKFEALVEDHGPTQQQKRDAKREGTEEPNWDPDTFPQALVTASLVSPELTLEEVDEIWESDDWNHAELTNLFLAAIEVNQQRKVLELKKGSGAI